MLWPEHINSVIFGDAIETMREIPDGVIQCCITSPPYWGLRDYDLEPIVWGGDNGCRHVWSDKLPPKPGAGNHPDRPSGFQQKSQAGQVGALAQMRSSEANNGQYCEFCSAWRGNLGLEPTPELYVEHLVEVFREARRVMRPDATLFLNLGDSYWGGKGQSSQAWSTENQDRDTLQKSQHQICGKGETRPSDGQHSILKQKDLCMIPARVALALQADGWWLRSVIIWHKPSCMPESVQDRPVNSHEYIYLLTKSAQYYYDNEAVRIYEKDKDLQYLQQKEADSSVLQEQPTGGWLHGQVCGLHPNTQKILRPQVQSDGEGESQCETLLLFREGSKSETEISERVQSEPKESSQTSSEVEKGQQNRSGKKRTGEVLAITKGQGGKTTEGQSLSGNSKRQGKQTENITQAKVPTQDVGLQSNIERMANHTEQSTPSMYILRGGKGVRKGSRDSTNEGGDTYEGQCGGGVSSLQRTKGQRRSHALRTVWTINTEQTPYAHFATFPQKLVEPCIMAGTSEKGNCGKCGKPWVRVVEKGGGSIGQSWHNHEDDQIQGQRATDPRSKGGHGYYVKTTGWQPSCDCGAEPVQPIVLDPFSGSGTVGVVAKRLQRRYVLSDLNAEYNRIAIDRLRQTELAL